jgi:hypothetical protein
MFIPFRMINIGWIWDNPKRIWPHMAPDRLQYPAIFLYPEQIHEIELPRILSDRLQTHLRSIFRAAGSGEACGVRLGEWSTSTFAPLRARYIVNYLYYSFWCFCSSTDCLHWIKPCFFVA